jgi:hypothetical protein
MSSYWNNRWPLERVLFALAATITLTSVLLATIVSPWFLLLTAFVGLNQWLYVTIGACPASLLLHRLFGFTACRLAGAADVTSGPTGSVAPERRIDA